MDFDSNSIPVSVDGAREDKSCFSLSIVKGDGIRSFIKEISALRSVIFRQWPYFYDAEKEYEEEYINSLAMSAGAFLVLAWKEKELIGCATGMPFNEAIAEVRLAYDEQGISQEGLLYLGELILLEAFRGKRLGLSMYQAFEKEAIKQGLYHKIVFCELAKEEMAPCPEDGRSLDAFWDKLGYREVVGPKCVVSYKEIGGAKKTPHTMTFKEKTLT